MPCRNIYYVITGTERKPEDQEHYLIAIGRKTSGEIVAEEGNPCLLNGCVKLYQDTIFGMPIAVRRPGPHAIPVNENDGFEMLDPVQAIDKLRHDERKNPKIMGFAEVLRDYYYANTGRRVE